MNKYKLIIDTSHDPRCSECHRCAQGCCGNICLYGYYSEGFEFVLCKDCMEKEMEEESTNPQDGTQDE